MTPLLYYAGIGSRVTPDEVLEEMHLLATQLGTRGYVLRSGKAIGADTAFEAGCLENNFRSEIWLPKAGYNNHEGVGYYPTRQHSAIARTLHPVWDKLPPFVQFLHARNVGQVLGSDCNTPVSFVVCWTPDGCEEEKTRSRKTGGTGTAIALASRHRIPVFNLFKDDALTRLDSFLDQHLSYPNKFNCFYSTAYSRHILPRELIFVFGSNLAGRHGKGAAKEAVSQYGAIYGQGIGLQGQSYGIPTKNEVIETLSVHDIAPYVHQFVEETQSGQRCYYVTAVGCGLAGYEAKDIAPLFKGAKYCWFPESWMPYLI